MGIYKFSHANSVEYPQELIEIYRSKKEEKILEKSKEPIAKI